MGRLRLNVSDPDSGTRAFRGHWWRPDDPEHRVAGLLDFTAASGGTLELQGGLVGDSNPPFRQVIFGESDGNRVTVCDAQYAGRLTRGMGQNQRVDRETWRCSSVYVNTHAKDGDDTAFEMFSLQTANLPAWVDVPEAKVGVGAAGSLIVEVAIPESISIPLGNIGTLSVEWSQSGHSSRFDVDLAVSASLNYDPEVPLAMEEAWGRFITPMLFFLTLATGAPDRITSLKAYQVGQRSSRFRHPVEILISVWAETLSHAAADTWQQTLPYGEYGTRLAELLPTWFVLVEKNRDTLHDFFSIDFAQHMFIEESFVRVTRSLESWHRTMIGGKNMPDEDFELLLSKARGALTAAEWEFAGSRLKNVPSLKRRLEELFDFCGQPITGLLSNYRRFPRRVVDTRNLISHEGRPGDSFSDVELLWAKKSLEQVFRVVLLRHLGLTAGEVQQSLGRSREWRMLRSPFNRLAYAEEYTRE